MQQNTSCLGKAAMYPIAGQVSNRKERYYQVSDGTGASAGAYKVGRYIFETGPPLFSMVCGIRQA